MDRVIAHELRVLASHGIAAADYPALLRLVESGQLRPDRLVRRHVWFADVPRALSDFGSAESVGLSLWVSDPSTDGLTSA